MEYNSEWFSDDMLVPILVGMDHLKKTGLILDFSDGHAVNGNDNPAVPYVMERNLKGHYMVNIAYYLFGSLSLTPRLVATNPLQLNFWSRTATQHHRRGVTGLN